MMTRENLPGSTKPKEKDAENKSLDSITINKVELI